MVFQQALNVEHSFVKECYGQGQPRCHSEKDTQGNDSGWPEVGLGRRLVRGVAGEESRARSQWPQTLCKRVHLSLKAAVAVQLQGPVF